MANLSDQEVLEPQKVAKRISMIDINDRTSSSSNGGSSNGLLWKDNAAVSEKQGKVGSLSFNVIDTSNKAKGVPEQKTPVKKSAPRAKVPFEKGYSQMDWLKLTRTHSDLAGILLYCFYSGVLNVVYCSKYLTLCCDVNYVIENVD